MKVAYIECNEDELRANRGIMDAIVDACQGMLGTLYGSCVPKKKVDIDEDNRLYTKIYTDAEPEDIAEKIYCAASEKLPEIIECLKEYAAESETEEEE